MSRRVLPPVRAWYEIKPTDVGRATIFAWLGRWNVADFMGRIQPQDVGKRIVHVGDGVLQVENDAQRDARVRKNPTQRNPPLIQKSGGEYIDIADAKRIIRRHYRLNRPVTDAEARAEIENLKRRRARDGEWGDDMNSRLAAALGMKL